MNFGQALRQMTAGQSVKRGGWDNLNQWIYVRNPDPNSDAGQSYIVHRQPNGMLIPWVAPHVDLLAEDWIVA